jgi:hypothetical protein
MIYKELDGIYSRFAFAANYFYEKSIKDCHNGSKSGAGSANGVPRNDKNNFWITAYPSIRRASLLA